MCVKMYLGLNNLHRLICHKIKPNLTKPRKGSVPVHLEKIDPFGAMRDLSASLIRRRPGNTERRDPMPYFAPHFPWLDVCTSWKNRRPPERGHQEDLSDLEKRILEWQEKHRCPETSASSIANVSMFRMFSLGCKLVSLTADRYWVGLYIER